MRRLYVAASALAAISLLAPADAALAQDEARTVASGGILVEGWQGKIDARAAQRGNTLDNARLAKEGDALHVTTGPAVAYWHPDNTASGDYTVTATFREPEYMALNNHPHPYGIFIAGSALGTDQQEYLYCTAYGNGRFIVRGFGPEPFRVNGRRAEEHEAVNKAAGKGEPVTQEIALSVRGDKVECAINGTVVGSYDKTAVLGEGKLGSTDGIYGIRFAHNTEAYVTGFGMTQQ